MSQTTETTLRAQLAEAQGRLVAPEQTMNDKTAQALTDALIDQIESAARASFRRHQGSIKGQLLTAADNYDWHLLHAAYQAGIQAMRAQLAEAQNERGKAIDLLETMFSSYENGTACYEDPEDCSGFVGYAFKMDDLDFNACCDLLNRTRPRAAIDAAKGEPS